MADQIGQIVGALPPFALPALAAVGAGALAYVGLTVLSALLFLVKSGVNVKKLGSWAVVTGATDGIGLGYAKELARKGFNLVIVSRTEQKLIDTRKAILEKFPNIEVKYVVADLSSRDEAIYKKIEAEIKDLEVGVLVNNAGLSYEHAEYLTDVDQQRLDDIIQINVIALTKITKIVLPGMVARKKGAILNVGSAAGIIKIGDPLYAVYSASKAYVDFFSRSLNLEVKSKGVIVENVVPYFVTSKMSKIRRASLTVPSADTFARSSLNRVGLAATNVPYVPHLLQHWVVQLLPEFIVSSYILSHHHGIRKRALKKKEK